MVIKLFCAKDGNFYPFLPLSLSLGDILFWFTILISSKTVSNGFLGLMKSQNFRKFSWPHKLRKGFVTCWYCFLSFFSAQNFATNNLIRAVQESAFCKELVLYCECSLLFSAWFLLHFFWFVLNTELTSLVRFVRPCFALVSTSFEW